MNRRHHKGLLFGRMCAVTNHRHTVSQSTRTILRRCLETVKLNLSGDAGGDETRELRVVFWPPGRTGGGRQQPIMKWVFPVQTCLDPPPVTDSGFNHRGDYEWWDAGRVHEAKARRGIERQVHAGVGHATEHRSLERYQQEQAAAPIRSFKPLWPDSLTLNTDSDTFWKTTALTAEGFFLESSDLCKEELLLANSEDSHCQIVAL